MSHHSLDGLWDLYSFPERNSPIRHPSDLARHRDALLAAHVPGNVELDLARAGRIADPLFGDNIHELRDYELYEWWYERTFKAPEEALDAVHTAELVFRGVDCLATYWLNNEKIGTSDNMLIAHHIDVTGHLRSDGPNTLTVRLASPMLEALRRPFDPSMATWGFGEGRLWVRKAAHSYGWDIMPRALSAGLWRSVDLVVHDEDEIRDLYVFTRSIHPDKATVGLYFEVATAPERVLDLGLHIIGRCGTSTFETRHPVRFKAGEISFEVPNPRLWWPHGYGDPDLYEATVELTCGDVVLARKTATFGIRTLALARTEITSPEHPGEFLFKVNDIPILCKGTNWVPADVFHSRDAERIPAILDMAVDLGCNIIRCWGGNVYEDTAFYDTCDRHGILVWQDFAMACARHPQDPAFQDAIRDEAVAVVRKLRAHPSIALWCGDNECDMLFQDPGKNRITRETLPQAVYQADPYRPYLPSSPYIAPESTARRELRPEQHLWGPRDYFKSDFYTQHTAHFVSEIGYHGCPNLSSIKQFIDEAHLWPWQDNIQWMTHCTAPAMEDDDRKFRVKLMADQIREFFGIEPDDLETFILASQISQAEAKKFFIEMTRLGKWRRTGVIWWNLMDGWPQFSDAVVDYSFGKKLAYHYIKRAQQPLCLMLEEPKNWHVRLVAGNDSRQDCHGEYRLWDADSGETLLEGVVSSQANTNTILGQVPVSRSDQRLFLIEWTVDTPAGATTGGNHYILGTPPFALDRYRVWLDQIAALTPNFLASDVGK
jgi:beta-mannosidase